MASAPHTPAPDWVVRDFGHSPVSVAAPGGGPCIAKVYVTEYRKRERSPELLRALRMITKAPSMVNALRDFATHPLPYCETDAEKLARLDDFMRKVRSEARTILAHIDGEG